MTRLQLIATLAAGVDPKRLVVIGASAGGHLTLMTLVPLWKADLPQPALAVGLCPWTDVGERGRSLHVNDRYDLVQGWMAVRFGEWLAGSSGASRETLSPIHQSYEGPTATASDSVDLPETCFPR